MTIFLRTPFNYNADDVSLETGLNCEDASLTIQSMAEDADINVIVKRFGISGTLPQSVVPPTYADYSDVMDYHTAMNAIRKADEAFMAMPADVRTRFNNDAGYFVDFCSKPENLDELRKLGLANASVQVPSADVSAPPAADGTPASGASS